LPARRLHVLQGRDDGVVGSQRAAGPAVHRVVQPERLLRQRLLAYVAGGRAVPGGRVAQGERARWQQTQRHLQSLSGREWWHHHLQHQLRWRTSDRGTRNKTTGNGRESPPQLTWGGGIAGAGGVATG